jgi:hypothetical protein
VTVYGVLNLTWVPSVDEQEGPPVGYAPAIVRNDPYTLVIRVTDGWADLGAETFSAQIRALRLTGTTDVAPEASFVVDVTQDGDDVLIVLDLMAESSTGLPTTTRRRPIYWDLQQDDGPTLLAGEVQVVDDVTRADT